MTPDNPIIEISDPTQLPAQPVVSVYMLAYNHERFIAEAIEGVVAQQCDFPIELVIGEDCSPDTTREVATDFQRRYPHLIRVLTAPVNVGAHANAARCRSALRGEFVAICEADDYWHRRDKLRIQVNLLRENPKAFLVHTDYDRRIGDRVLRSVHKLQKKPHLAVGDAFVPLLLENTVVTATAMYRKVLLSELAKTNILREDWPFGDYPTALFAALKGPVVYLPASTATYRKVEGSVMNRGYLQALQLQKASLACRRFFMKLKRPSAEQVLQVEFLSCKKIMQASALAGDSASYEFARQFVVANSTSRATFPFFPMSLIANHSALRIPYLFLRRKWRELKFHARSRWIHTKPEP